VQTNMKKTTTKMFLLVLSASFLAVMASAQPATFNFNTLEGLNVLSYTGTIGASSPYVGAQGRCTDGWTVASTWQVSNSCGYTLPSSSMVGSAGVYDVIANGWANNNGNYPGYYQQWGLEDYCDDPGGPYGFYNTGSC